MTATLTIIQYRKRYIFFALLAMAVHRFPLYFNKKISFWKLMGSGKNGTFDKTPDWQQWAILTVTDQQILITPHHFELHKMLYGPFIAKWYRFFNCKTLTYILQPLEGHGLWDGKKAFGPLNAAADHEGEIAVLTRATIRMAKLKQFWKHVNPVADLMAGTKGFIRSYGIGEIPWLKQATFSIWQSKADMKAFAYKMHEHAEVIRKTRAEKWYSEDMFVRFAIIAVIS